MKPVIVIKYVDTLDQLIWTCSAAAKFLEMHNDPQRIRAVIKRSAFKRLQSQKARPSFVERPKDVTDRLFRAGKSRKGH